MNGNNFEFYSLFLENACRKTNQKEMRFYEILNAIFFQYLFKTCVSEIVWNTKHLSETPQI